MKINLRSYIIGFLLSLLFTLFAYALATHAVPAVAGLPMGVSIALIIGFAFAQFIAQLIHFLHLNLGRESRDKLIILCATVFIVIILVSGSLWIMNQLNGRMMPDAAQMTQYMQDQAGM
jgi:cytochrome o ubiquinol oxidase operon protein cyoD